MKNYETKKPRKAGLLFTKKSLTQSHKAREIPRDLELKTSNWKIQDYYELRDECLKNQVLFEDPDFPCEDSSLLLMEKQQHKIEWKRPKEIVKSPKFFVQGASLLDIQQGILGDCWLLAAMANLTLYPDLFDQVVHRNQSFDEKYAGIFHFRFWQYGAWVDICVDDRLPTIDGKLVYLSSSQPNEFWSALMEKAYAKLHGSYVALLGGSAGEAMEDFTGGISEMYELNDDVQPDLFKILLKAHNRSSLMSCSTKEDPEDRDLKTETPEGLLRGHTYSITKVKYVHAKSKMSGKFSLIRLQNPWGNEPEWNGPWSDKSPEWKSIPDSEKENIELTFDKDGEFWMSFTDFVKYFDRLEICNLNPVSLIEDAELETKWETRFFDGEWVRGVTAGGCGNNISMIADNPQYRFTLTNPDKNKSSVIVSLMQKNRRARGMENLHIGIAIYQLKDPENLLKPLDTNFFVDNEPCACSPNFFNLREISCRFSLSPGVYCIIPSTFDLNEEGEFLLRVFSEQKSCIRDNEKDMEEEKSDHSIFSPTTIKFKDSREVTEEVQKRFFIIAGKDKEIDWQGLQDILYFHFGEETDLELPNDNSNGDQNNSFISALFSCFCNPCVIDTVATVLDNVDSKSNDSGDNISSTVFGNSINLFSIFCNTLRSSNTSLNQSSNFIDTEVEEFSEEICRSMIAMYDFDRSGKLGFEEFKLLWANIADWKEIFQTYDINGNNQINSSDLREALKSAGYTDISDNILSFLVHRYGTDNSFITLNNFMMCAIKLKTMTDIFKERDFENSGKATFTVDEWFEWTLYS